jgi:hypothetical protein
MIVVKPKLTPGQQSRRDGMMMLHAVELGAMLTMLLFIGLHFS